MAILCTLDLMSDSLSRIDHQLNTHSEAEERAFSGQLFSASRDAWLRDAYYRARQLCFDYNRLPMLEQLSSDQEEILGRLFHSIGPGSRLVPPLFVDYGIHTSIGEYSFVNTDVVLLDAAPIRIGDRVLIGPRVGIYTSQHPLDPEQRKQGLEYAEPITIEDDVWIGAGVTILSGVTIGRGSVVAAGSVVVHSVPEKSLIAGNPAQIIRMIGEKSSDFPLPL